MGVHNKSREPTLASYKCEVLFTPEHARIVQGIIEDATSLPCPCKRGLTCPLFNSADMDD